MAIRKDYNPFANLDIHLPKAYLDEFRRYTRGQGADDTDKGRIEDVPFSRYIDFWTAAVAIGAAETAHVKMDASDKHRFITGAVMQNDLQRIEFLMLIAIAHTEDPFVVSEPRKVLDIAEGYAAGGTPILLDMLREGHLPALHNVNRALIARLTEPASATP